MEKYTELVELLLDGSGDDIQDCAADAAAAIKKLLAENECYKIELKGISMALDSTRSQLEMVTRERDAAVSDLEDIAFMGDCDVCTFCKSADCYAKGGNSACSPVWRGVQEVDHEQ